MRDLTPNEELTTRAIAAWNTGDAGAAVELCAPDCVMLPVITGTIVGDPYRGHDGVRAWFRDYIEAFDEFQFTAEEMRDFGDRILVVGRVHAKGYDSGIEIDQPFAFCSTIRDGLAVRFRSFLDVEAATAAAEKGEI